MTGETFAEIMSILEVVYGRTFSERELRGWRQLIGDLPDDAAREATRRVCKTVPYPPKPADIVCAVIGTPKDVEAMRTAVCESGIRHMEMHLRDDVAVDLGGILNRIVREFGGPDAICAAVRDGTWRFRRAEAARAFYALWQTGVVYVAPERPDGARYIEAALTQDDPRARTAALESWRTSHAAAYLDDPDGVVRALFAVPSIPGLPTPGRLALPASAESVSLIAVNGAP